MKVRFDELEDWNRAHRVYSISSAFFFSFNIYLAALGLSCGMWDLVPWPGIRPRPPSLGVWSFSQWTTREAQQCLFLKNCCYFIMLLYVQFTCSAMSNSATPWTAACQASLSVNNSWSPPEPMSIKSMMPSNGLILCHPLLLLPSIFPSIRVLSDESALRIWWPKYWSFSFNISPSTQDWCPLGWTG